LEEARPTLRFQPAVKLGHLLGDAKRKQERRKAQSNQDRADQELRMEVSRKEMAENARQMEEENRNKRRMETSRLEMVEMTRLLEEERKEKRMADTRLGPPGGTPHPTGEDDFDREVGRHARAVASEIQDEEAEGRRKERLRREAEEARGAISRARK
jgi:hypothetical protein